jgi:hypothetical protein
VSQLASDQRFPFSFTRNVGVGSLLRFIRLNSSNRLFSTAPFRTSLHAGMSPSSFGKMVTRHREHVTRILAAGRKALHKEEAIRTLLSPFPI